MAGFLLLAHQGRQCRGEMHFVTFELLRPWNRSWILLLAVFALLFLRRAFLFLCYFQKALPKILPVCVAVDLGRIYPAAQLQQRPCANLPANLRGQRASTPAYDVRLLPLPRGMSSSAMAA